VGCECERRHKSGELLGGSRLHLCGRVDDAAVARRVTDDEARDVARWETGDDAVEVVLESGEQRSDVSAQ
jgi:hypothetical protein